MANKKIEIDWSHHEPAQTRVKILIGNRFQMPPMAAIPLPWPVSQAGQSSEYSADKRAFLRLPVWE